MLIRRARRSTRALGLIAAAGTVAALTAAAAPAHAAAAVSTSCQTVVLPVPAGTTSSSVNGGDFTGHYLVGVAYGGGGSTGVLWHGGQATQLDASVLTPYYQADFNDVNSHGVVVGERITDPNSLHTDAFVYRHGQFTLLPAPNQGDETNAVAINSRGDVVGNAWDAATGWRPVVWPAGRPGTVRVLSLPAGTNAYASDIDEDGTVVGYLQPNPPGTPYVWPARGLPRALPLPAGSDGGNAVAIRRGMVAGNVSDPVSGLTSTALWNLRTGGVTVETGNGAYSVNRWGTLGLAGAIVHSDGRVVTVGGLVTVLSDGKVAAGPTSLFGGHAVEWIGC